jgi:hypothetical protein
VGFDQAPLPDDDAASVDLRIPDERQAQPGVVPVLPESVERILAEIGWSLTDSDDMLRGTYETDEAGNSVPQRDFLSGEGGNDSLRGGGNSDVLMGGPDADTFIFRASDFDDGMTTLDIISDFDIDEGDRLLGDQSDFRIVEPGDAGPFGQFGPFGFGIMLEHTPTGDYIFIHTSDTDLTLDQLFG